MAENTVKDDAAKENTEKNVKDDAAKENAEKKAVKKYSKEQFLKSEGYKANRDLLAVILEDNKKYSKSEADALIKKYMEGKVK